MYLLFSLLDLELLALGNSTTSWGLKAKCGGYSTELELPTDHKWKGQVKYSNQISSKAKILFKYLIISCCNIGVHSDWSEFIQLQAMFVLAFFISEHYHSCLKKSLSLTEVNQVKIQKRAKHVLSLRGWNLQCRMAKQPRIQWAQKSSIQTGNHSWR